MWKLHAPTTDLSDSLDTIKGLQLPSRIKSSRKYVSPNINGELKFDQAVDNLCTDFLIFLQFPEICRHHQAAPCYTAVYILYIFSLRSPMRLAVGF